MDQKIILANTHIVETTEAEKPASKDNEHNKLKQSHSEEQVKEIGGPKGPEPTRFGDWEKRGRCIDF